MLLCESMLTKNVINHRSHAHVGGCQNYGPFFGSLIYPKRDHDFDNHPYVLLNRARIPTQHRDGPSFVARLLGLRI